MFPMNVSGNVSDIFNTLATLAVPYYTTASTTSTATSNIATKNAGRNTVPQTD